MTYHENTVAPRQCLLEPEVRQQKDRNCVSALAAAKLTQGRVYRQRTDVDDLRRRGLGLGPACCPLRLFLGGFYHSGRWSGARLSAATPAASKKSASRPAPARTAAV